jgi:hypothetical protein
MQGRLQITHGSSPPKGSAAKAMQKDDEHRPVEVPCENDTNSISQTTGVVNRLLVLEI